MVNLVISDEEKKARREKADKLIQEYRKKNHEDGFSSDSVILPIEDSFEYLAESEKLNFQANLHSLIELNARKLNKVSWAKSNNKSIVCYPLDEEQILNRHELETLSKLMASYENLNQTIRHQNIQLKAKDAIIEHLESEQVAKDEILRKVFAKVDELRSRNDVLTRTNAVINNVKMEVV